MCTLPILFGYNVSGRGNSSIPLVFAKEWNTKGLQTLLYSPSMDAKFHFDWLKPALRGLTKGLIYQLCNPHIPKILSEKHLLKHEGQRPYVYLWAGLSLDVFEKLHDNGCKILLERINCHQVTAKSILDHAYFSLGISPQHTITKASIEEEGRKLELADTIFCPSPMVYQSMIENGIDHSKLLLTSYGRAPERFPLAKSVPNEAPTVRFLFVGSICIRKGIHLLIEAWKKTAINGTLTLCGAMDNLVCERYGDFFCREDVTHIPYTPDIATYYNACDVFLFPSLEEGGPMVTYEAMAHAAVPLVSKMGAGSIVEEGKNGLVLKHEAATWAAAITSIAENKEKRQKLGLAACQRANEFTWPKVAERRAEHMRQRYPLLWSQEEVSSSQ